MAKDPSQRQMPGSSESPAGDEPVPSTGTAVPEQYRARPSRLGRASARLRRSVKRGVASLTPPDPEHRVMRNAYFLQREVIWTGLVGAATSFASNFVVRLGGSNQLVGILNSAPSLMIVLLTLPAARFLDRRPNRIKWIVGGRAIQRGIFLLIALMPLLVRPQYQAAAFVALTLLRQVTLAPQNAGWSALFADLVPERSRTYVVARRRIIMSGVTILATPLLGRMLDGIVFPYGYQLAYAVAFVAGMVGIGDLYQLRDPQPPAARPAEEPRPRAESRRFSLARTWRDHQGFWRLTLNTLVPSLGAWTAMPLYTIYFLRHLGASDAWMGSLSSVGNISLIAGTYLWQRMIPRWGESRVLKWLMPLLASYPLIVGLSSGLTPILVAAVIQNLVMAGTNMAHFNVLLMAAPADQRSTYISIYTTIMNVGSFVAPMFGTWLADRVAFPHVLLGAAALRVAGGLLFTLLPVRLPKHSPAS